MVLTLRYHHSTIRVITKYRHGPVAQLVERLVCNEEASGSNPLRSNTKPVHSELVL